MNAIPTMPNPTTKIRVRGVPSGRAGDRVDRRVAADLAWADDDGGGGDGEVVDVVMLVRGIEGR
jgi:hypothetical protein